MRWNNELNKVEYKICSAWYDASVLSAIQPYTDYDIKTNKEEDMSDLKKCGTATIKYIQENGSRDMELIIPYNQEIVNIDGKYILRDKKPQYPKTYEECCQVLMGKTDFQDFELVLTRYAITRSEENSISLVPPHISLINNFYKLLICRDAYWKIAGEQMGLDKPWNPDWKDDSDKHFICYLKDELWMSNIRECNRFLVFPTKEMRDEFYNNFKELIESCKELL